MWARRRDDGAPERRRRADRRLLRLTGWSRVLGSARGGGGRRLEHSCGIATSLEVQYVSAARRGRALTLTANPDPLTLNPSPLNPSPDTAPAPAPVLTLTLNLTQTQTQTLTPYPTPTPIPNPNPNQARRGARVDGARPSSSEASGSSPAHRRGARDGTCPRGQLCQWRRRQRWRRSAGVAEGMRSFFSSPSHCPTHVLLRTRGHTDARLLLTHVLS